MMLNPRAEPFPLLLLSALCARATAGGTGGSAVFVNPPPAVSWHGEEPTFGSDPVWTLGETQVVKWTSSFPQFNIEFWQQLGENGANKGPTIFAGTTETEFKWVVQDLGFSLDDSNVFFMFIYNPENPSTVGYLPSGYFNITEPKVAPPPPPPVTTKSPAQSPTKSPATKSPDASPTTASSSPPAGTPTAASSSSDSPKSTSGSSTGSHSPTASSTGDSASSSKGGSSSSPTSSPSSSSPTNPPLTNADHATSTNPLSTGAKVGIALGALGLVAIAGLLGALLLAYLRRHNSAGATKIPDEMPEYESWRKANAWAAGQPGAEMPTELESWRDPAELEHARTPVELAGLQYPR